MDGMEIERQLLAANLAGRAVPRSSQLDAPSLADRVRSTAHRVGVHLVHLFSSILGDDVLSRCLRKAALRSAGAKLAPESMILGEVWVSNPPNLELGVHAIVNRRCYFDLEAPVKLGDYSGAGHGATFITTVHEIVPGMNLGVGVTARPITVGERAWIGANATIMPGVTIGHDAIVATSSLVSRDVPPNTLVAGVPARIVRRGVREWIEDPEEACDDVSTPPRLTGTDRLA